MPRVRWACCLYCAQLIDTHQRHVDASVRQQSAVLLDLLTPVAKAFPSAYGPKANDLAIQCLGGYGYTRDYPVEQYYRDNRLNPIHEGTNGIQALDLLGRKLIRDDGGSYRALRAVIDLDLQDGNPESVAVAASWKRIDASVKTIFAAFTRGHAAETLANASAFLDAFSLAVIAWASSRTGARR